MKNMALHIMDLIENSASAGATEVMVCVHESREDNDYRITIEDNGKGMTEKELCLATDPFYTSRSTRKVGLGLPLIRLNAERTGGTFSLSSEPGKGTKLDADFVFDHPDRLPVGEIEEVLVTLTIGLSRMRLIYEHKTDTACYKYDTAEICKAIGSPEEYNFAIRQFLKEMIRENLINIQADL